MWVTRKISFVVIFWTFSQPLITDPCKHNKDCSCWKRLTSYWELPTIINFRTSHCNNYYTNSTYVIWCQRRVRSTLWFSKIWLKCPINCEIQKHNRPDFHSFPAHGTTYLRTESADIYTDCELLLLLMQNFLACWLNLRNNIREIHWSQENSSRNNTTSFVWYKD